MTLFQVRLEGRWESKMEIEALTEEEAKLRAEETWEPVLGEVLDVIVYFVWEI